MDIVSACTLFVTGVAEPITPLILTMDQEHWDIIIKPRKKLLDVDLKGIWQYRDLFWQYVKRDIVTIYKQTVLGPMWFLIQPILTTVMYKFVFANIAGVSTGNIPADLFYMSGVVLWNYFSACFATGQTAFTGNSNVFSKVYFPRLVAPLSGITSGLLKAFIQCVPLVFVWLYRPRG